MPVNGGYVCSAKWIGWTNIHNALYMLCRQLDGDTQCVVDMVEGMTIGRRFHGKKRTINKLTVEEGYC